MFPARLIIGGSQDERRLAAQQLVEVETGIKRWQNHPDLILLDEEGAISIKQIRQMEKSLHLKPYQAPTKAALILEADKLTIPAQNALLKTLEEPPQNSLIVLVASQKESLLETITSRCRISSLQSQPKKTKADLEKSLLTLTEILLAPIGKRFQRVEEARSNRESVISLTESLFEVWHHLLQTKVNQPNPATKSLASLTFTQIQSGLDNTFQALKALRVNVNPKLVLGNLFASYPHLE